MYMFFTAELGSTVDPVQPERVWTARVQLYVAFFQEISTTVPCNLRLVESKDVESQIGKDNYMLYVGF